MKFIVSPLNFVRATEKMRKLPCARRELAYVWCEARFEPVLRRQNAGYPRGARELAGHPMGTAQLVATYVEQVEVTPLAERTC